MAIYHMSAQVIGRSSGRSVTAAAAYRSGEKIVDERTGEIHDYTKKGGVDYSEIMLPENCGDWAKDRAQLWNMTEQAEKRKDAQLCREINIAIPVELSKEQGRELVRDYAQENFVLQGMIADVCIHGENTKNPHAHIMLSMREAGEDGLGKKVREWNDKEQLEKWREEWAHQCNKSLARAGVNFTIDHRSYEAQGLDQVPTIHQGPTATAIERKGESSDLGQINREIAELNATNAHIEAARKEIEEINKTLAEIQISTPEETITKTTDSSLESNAAIEAAKQAKREEEDRKIKDAACYGISARDAFQKLHEARGKLHTAEVNLHHAKEEQAAHNKKVDNMGFLSKAFSSGAVNQQAQEIDKKLDTLTVEVERRKEDVNKLEKAHGILQGREREQQQQKASSPEVIRTQQEEKERFLAQMREKRERERGSRGR